jgi:hypothetical protein
MDSATNARSLSGRAVVMAKASGLGILMVACQLQSLERPERLSTGCRVREVAEFEKFEER